MAQRALTAKHISEYFKNDRRLREDPLRVMADSCIQVFALTEEELYNIYETGYICKGLGLFSRNAFALGTMQFIQFEDSDQQLYCTSTDIVDQSFALKELLGLQYTYDELKEGWP